MEKSTHISSIAELIQAVKSKQRGRRLLFRGVRDERYKLLPKLGRESETNDDLRAANPRRSLLELQSILLGRFKRFGSRFVGNARVLSDTEWLCVAQHYGLPTLLLDWSLDPLVSLYFASSRHAENDGSLYVMRLKPRADRRGSTFYIGEDDDRKPLKVREEDARSNSDTGPALIVPMLEDARINAQSGRFIYMAPHYVRGQNPMATTVPDLEASDWTEADPPWEDISSFLVPADSKRVIQQELQYLQFHGGRVFPELPAYSQYLAAGGR